MTWVASSIPRENYVDLCSCRQTDAQVELCGHALVSHFCIHRLEPSSSRRGKSKLRDIEVAVFDQKRETLDLEATLFDFIGEGKDFVTMPDGRQKHVISYLEDFLFHRDQVNRPIHTLSGGEKNHLQLAKFRTKLDKIPVLAKAEVRMRIPD